MLDEMANQMKDEIAKMDDDKTKTIMNNDRQIKWIEWRNSSLKSKSLQRNDF